jgi:hypothetical protein
MAILNSPFEFTGSFGNLTAYRSSHSDKIIIRAKAGPRRKKGRSNSPSTINERLTTEFGARSLMSTSLVHCLRPLKLITTYNISGKLHSRMKSVQDRDQESEFGKRNVLLSHHAQILDGFPLNNKLIPENIVKAPVSYALDKENLYGMVDIPELIPGINFVNPYNQSYYGFQLMIGVVANMKFMEGQYKPAHGIRFFPVDTESPWFACVEGGPALKLEVSLANPIPLDDVTVVLAFGIRFGYPGGNNTIVQKKGEGSGKILAAR